MFQVCVKDRRNRNEPMEISCLDYSDVYDKTMNRLRQAAEEKARRGVVVRSTTAEATSTATTTATTTTPPTTTKR